MQREIEQLGRPTRIETELINGKARLTVLDQGYHLGVRPMLIKDNYIKVGMVSNHMPLLGRDKVQIEVIAGEGVILEVIEPSGLVAYDSDGIRGDYNIQADIKKRGVLIWHGAEFIAAQGSNAYRNTTINIAEKGRALFKEELVLGRTGEHNICLNNKIQGTLDGIPLLMEELALTPQIKNLPGIVGQSKAINTITALGFRPTNKINGFQRLDLEKEGAVWRSMAEAAHITENEAMPVFEQWKEEVAKNLKIEEGISV